MVAPLDWGLGHTARCVPVMRYLQAQGHNVIFAGNAAQRAFITHSFEQISCIHLDGYEVAYSKWNRFAQIGVLSQLPRLISVISKEHQWLLHMAEELQLDGIISDNRYGLHHPRIPSVIMTHQLQVQTGIGPVADRLVQRMHYRHLDRFAATWVVDVPGQPNLAGKLAHPAVLPKHAQYIGLLSRSAPDNDTATGKDAPLLILLSGPEPQRTELSRLLWQQAVQYKDDSIIFIEGSDKAAPPTTIPTHIAWYARITEEELTPLLHKAGMVVCRSGYSTLMDLVAVNKHAILIPTPGQTEQQYLAAHLQQQGIFYSMPQAGFELEKALKEAAQFPYYSLGLQWAFNGHKQVIAAWLRTL